MKKLFAALLITFIATCGCAYLKSGKEEFKAQDFKFHKHTLHIKVHWNVISDGKTALAEGFVEPFSPGEGLLDVRLKLVALDGSGKEVNSVEGMPRDIKIESPYWPASPFRLAMPLNGGEKSFTVAGRYQFYPVGGRIEDGSRSMDYIPVEAGEAK